MVIDYDEFSAVVKEIFIIILLPVSTQMRKIHLCNCYSIFRLLVLEKSDYEL